MFTLAAISISGLLWFLIYVACLVAFIFALRWLAAKARWAINDTVWSILGFILVCFLLLYLLGALGGGSSAPLFRR
jgi:Flp pilus assembly protein protease CpaA